MPGYPENCVESCEKTLSMMPTFFEVDFSFTKDSVMVLMHDLTVDRTTNGKGKVEDYTFEEIPEIHSGVGQGQGGLQLRQQVHQHKRREP